MLGRVLTAIFWAAIFFALGAWSGGRLQPVGAVIVTGTKAIGHGAREAWNWAFYESRSSAVRDSGGAGTSASPHDLAGPGNGSGDLGAARQAFAEGKVKEAISAYKAFIADHPANADAHGELGNVFYYNGQVGEAAKSYYSAGLFLLAEGRVSEATALVPAIRVGAAGLADELQSRAALAAATPVALPTQQTAPVATPAPPPVETAANSPASNGDHEGQAATH